MSRSIAESITIPNNQTMLAHDLVLLDGAEILILGDGEVLFV